MQLGLYTFGELTPRGSDGKRISAQHKIDRRLGENLWGRPKSPLNKREYGPGQHGQRRRGKTSDFGTQLKALPESYLRYLQNALRDAFDLKGTPIRFALRTTKNPYTE